MKLLSSFIAALALALFSTTAGADDMSDNKKNLMNFYAAFSEGDLDALDKVLIEDWVTYDANPGQGAGRQGLKDFIPLVAASFSDFEWKVEELIEEGNVIVARSTFSGTHSGEFMGHAATGKPFTAKAIDVHHFNDEGMVTHTYHLEDWIAVLAQIGALDH
ncbi:ester cyclase [Shimia sp. R10_1]|uniref:ester cyclase n=1 Tax=Shimia sp. R10_1 TaxID=2821095 RepID=UPI001ADA580B|nr:ester cyclase [Shimia sp. R10_1]MBO9473374.1 ester cyclase [Shimia sp. R10_1]